MWSNYLYKLVFIASLNNKSNLIDRNRNKIKNNNMVQIKLCFIYNLVYNLIPKIIKMKIKIKMIIKSYTENIRNKEII